LSDVPDLGYGRQFAGIYHFLFPRGDEAAALLASLHPGDGSPSLELGVGDGRVALPLAERTGMVTGVDSSVEMLDALRAALARRSCPVRPVHADIRSYRDPGRYGLVYCICSTLNLVMDPGDQRRTMGTCSRSLAPGGHVVIEIHNPEAVIAWHRGHGQRSDSGRLAADTTITSHATLDLDTRVWRVRHVFTRDGVSHEASEEIRMPSAEELDVYAEEAGLSLTGRYSDWHGSSFTGREPMIISVYRAREEA
jgi:SAM-dependent methyltransferase